MIQWVESVFTNSMIVTVAVSLLSWAMKFVKRSQDLDLSGLVGIGWVSSLETDKVSASVKAPADSCFEKEDENWENVSAKD